MLISDSIRHRRANTENHPAKSKMVEKNLPSRNENYHITLQLQSGWTFSAASPAYSHTHEYNADIICLISIMLLVQPLQRAHRARNQCATFKLRVLNNYCLCSSRMRFVDVELEREREPQQRSASSC